MKRAWELSDARAYSSRHLSAPESNDLDVLEERKQKNGWMLIVEGKGKER